MNKPVSIPPKSASAVRLVGEYRASHPSERAAIESLAARIGCSVTTLHAWVRRHETDTGQHPGVTTAEAQGVKELERENKELRQKNEILKLPALRCVCARRDESLIPHIERVWQAHL